MNTSQVVTALAQIASRKPEFERPLSECLRKLIKSTLLKSPTIEALQSVYRVTGREFSTWLAKLPAEVELNKLLKKFDPHGNDGTASRSVKQLHLLNLMSGELKPAPRPSKPRISTKPPAMNAEEILRLTDPDRRRAELERLSAAQLKSAIKKHEVSGGSLSSKPSKTELIEHIQAAIQSGWPRAGSVLDGSRY